MFLTILFVVILLSLFLFITFIFENALSFLPILNLITLTFGHSHLAAILLLALPISWWFYDSHYLNIIILKQFLLAIVFLALFLTFGRLAIFLGLISLFFLIKKKMLKRKKWAYLFSIASIFILFGIILVSIQPGECFSSVFTNQVCKPITKEVRPEYFKQALYAFKDFPLFGYGPGTFSLITKKYNFIGQFGSVFTHNFFLQVMSESGFFASFFLVLIIFAIIQQVMNRIKTNGYRPIEYYLAISFSLLLINSLLDFDWNVFFTLQLSLIFAAGFIKKSGKLYQTKLFSIMWHCLATLIILIGFVVILTKVLLADKQYSIVAEIFPYNRHQAKKLVESKDIKDQEINKILQIYWYDPDILFSAINSITNEKTRLEIYAQLLTTSPWITTNTQYFKLLESKNMYEQMGVVAHNGLLLMDNATKKGYPVRHQIKEEVASFLQQSANFHLSNGDVNIAAKYYKKVLEVEKWAFQVREPFFVNEKVSLKQTGELLKKINANSELFGKNTKLFREWFVNKIETELLITSPSDVLVYNVYFGDEGIWYLISFAITEYIRLIPEREWKQYYDWWFDFWLLYITSVKAEFNDKHYHYVLMNTLFRFGEDEKARVIQRYLYEGKLPLK